jgi:hypothetical protein
VVQDNFADRRDVPSRRIQPANVVENAGSVAIKSVSLPADDRRADSGHARHEAPPSMDSNKGIVSKRLAA